MNRQAAATGVILAWAIAGGALGALPARAECKLNQLVELPVTMVDGRPTVPVKVNGHEAPFFLDSGASFGNISPSWAQRLGVRPRILFGLKVKGVGGTDDLSVATVDEFMLGNAPVRHMDFAVVQGLEPSVAGAVGDSLLGAFDTEFDMANGVVRLFKPEGCGDKSLAYWAPTASVLGIEDTDRARRAIFTAVYVNGRRLRAKWDTGSPRSLLALAAAEHAGVTSKSEGAVPSGKIGGYGPDLSDSWIAPFDSFTIGVEQIQHTRLRFADVSLGDHDMLLGMDFFLSHRIYVANSQSKVYFTYNGGPVFGLDGGQAPVRVAPGLPTSGEQEPIDAAGLARRAAAYRSRLDYPAAVADLDKAIALEPRNADLYLSRAQTLASSGQRVRAMADLDEALALKPDDVPALMGRGALHALAGDGRRAKADLAAAARLGANDPTVGLKVGAAYTAMGLFEDALATYDAWLTAHPRAPNPETDRTGAAESLMALNGRCWARAVLKWDLDKAEADCDAALKLSPREPAILDSRGLVRLGRGEFDLAIADYDAAVKLAPKAALTLFARGIAEQRKGRKDVGDADIKAALALEPRVADQARRFGLVAEGAAPAQATTAATADPPSPASPIPPH